MRTFIWSNTLISRNGSRSLSSWFFFAAILSRQSALQRYKQKKKLFISHEMWLYTCLYFCFLLISKGISFFRFSYRMAVNWYSSRLFTPCAVIILFETSEQTYDSARSNNSENYHPINESSHILALNWHQTDFRAPQFEKHWCKEMFSLRASVSNYRSDESGDGRYEVTKRHQGIYNEGT